MLEQQTELSQLFKIARSVRSPVLVRLDALIHLTQTLDRLFAQQLLAPRDLHQQPPGQLSAPLTITAAEAAQVFAQVRQIVQRRIIPRLKQQQIYLASPENLTPEAQAWLRHYFTQRIYPLLTPLAVDPGHPFPYISSNSLNYLMLLQPPTPSSLGPNLLFARVKVPRTVVPRIVLLPGSAFPAAHEQPVQYLVWSEDIVRYFAARLFPGMLVKGIYEFHILRSAPPLPDTKAEAKKQKRNLVVRLDVEERMPEWLLRWLLEHLDVPPDAVVRSAAPLNIAGLSELAEMLNTLLAAADQSTNTNGARHTK